MADQPKRKKFSERGARNEDRKNRKAWKVGNKTSGVRLSEVQKVNIGGGLLVNCEPLEQPKKRAFDERVF